jgi:carbamoyl-phosphate synthase large subunit
VPAIDALCRQMHECLQPNGPFNVQLMLDASGQPHVFEVNPRYSTTVALTLAAGIDEVDVVLRHALGETLEPLSFREDFMMLRYSTQTYLPEAEWHERYVERLAE